MRYNISAVLDREEKLETLGNRAEALQEGANQFESSAGKLKRKMWWQNCKVSPEKILSHKWPKKCLKKYFRNIFPCFTPLMLCCLLIDVKLWTNSVKQVLSKQKQCHHTSGNFCLILATTAGKLISWSKKMFMILKHNFLFRCGSFWLWYS